MQNLFFFYLPNQYLSEHWLFIELAISYLFSYLQYSFVLQMQRQIICRYFMYCIVLYMHIVKIVQKILFDNHERMEEEKKNE